jgi:hypothetical protein
VYPSPYELEREARLRTAARQWEATVDQYSRSPSAVPFRSWFADGWLRLVGRSHHDDRPPRTARPGGVGGRTRPSDRLSQRAHSQP